jgi:hypothetical protein
LCFMLLCFAGCAFSFTYSGHHHSQSFRSIGAPSTQVRASRQNFFSFFRRKTETKSDKGQAEDADIVVVGGGVSGLTAAITAAEIAKEKKNELKIVLVEGSSELGGRVQSEVTEDGFVLDKGFAVFIDQYPEAKKVLDFEALKLKPFLPGALVKLKSRNKLARVSDPLR